MAEKNVIIVELDNLLIGDILDLRYYLSNTDGHRKIKWKEARIIE